METVSIIVPIYNVAAYLRRCLDSLVQQTYQQMELLCINDGSTDESLVILKEYAIDSRVVIIDQENQGLSNARNAGMRQATGAYIMFVDSDDYLKEDSVAVLVSAMEDGIDLVELPIYDAFDEEIRYAKYQTPISLSNVDLKENPERLFEIGVYACGKLYRNSLFQELRFPPHLLHEDNYVATCLLPSLRIIRKVSEGGYFYYQRKNSITNAYNANMYDMIAIQKRIHLFYQVNDLLSTYGWICEKMAVRNLCVAILGKKMAFLKKEYWHTRKAHYQEVKIWMKGQYPSWRSNRYVTTKEKLFVSVLLFDYVVALFIWKGVRLHASSRL